MTKTRKLRDGTFRATMIAYVRSCGPEGASRPEIAKALGIESKRVSGHLTECAGRHGLIKAGPPKHIRFFVEPEHAAAFTAQLPAMLAKKRADAYQRILANQRKYGREKTARLAAARPPKPPKVERPKKPARPQVKLKLGNDAPVRVGASRAALAAAQIVIPAHVEVQRGPAWTHDVRFQVEPGRRVLGEFTVEWRQRRA